MQIWLSKELDMNIVQSVQYKYYSYMLVRELRINGCCRTMKRVKLQAKVVSLIG